MLYRNVIAIGAPGSFAARVQEDPAIAIGLLHAARVVIENAAFESGECEPGLREFRISRQAIIDLRNAIIEAERIA